MEYVLDGNRELYVSMLLVPTVEGLLFHSLSVELHEGSVEAVRYTFISPNGNIVIETLGDTEPFTSLLRLSGVSVMATHLASGEALNLHDPLLSTYQTVVESVREALSTAAISVDVIDLIYSTYYAVLGEGAVPKKIEQYTYPARPPCESAGGTGTFVAYMTKMDNIVRAAMGTMLDGHISVATIIPETCSGPARATIVHDSEEGIVVDLRGPEDTMFRLTPSRDGLAMNLYSPDETPLRGPDAYKALIEYANKRRYAVLAILPYLPPSQLPISQPLPGEAPAHIFT